MSLTTDQVRNVARLARLGLDDDQVDSYATDLSRIVDVFSALERVDTQAVEPMSHPRDPVAPLRADVSVPVVDREAFQAVAPAVEDGLYIVPRVIE